MHLQRCADVFTCCFAISETSVVAVKRFHALAPSQVLPVTSTRTRPESVFILPEGEMGCGGDSLTRWETCRTCTLCRSSLVLEL